MSVVASIGDPVWIDTNSLTVGKSVPVSSGTADFCGTGTTFDDIIFDHKKPLWDPCSAGHMVSEQWVEYIDGVLVGKCDVCNTRVTMDRIPGGSTPLRIRGLLEDIMDSDEGDVSAQVDALGELESQLEKERKALERAFTQLELARQVVETRCREAMA